MMKYNYGWSLDSIKNKCKQRANDKLANGPICSVAYCAAGVELPVLVWALSSVVGGLLCWWGTDGQPKAGSQMLPLQVILQISFHLQLSGSFSTATDWRTEVNLSRGCWNILPVVHIRGLRVCTGCVCLFPTRSFCQCWVKSWQFDDELHICLSEAEESVYAAKPTTRTHWHI